MNGFYGNNNFGGYGNPALGVSYGYNYQQPQQPPVFNQLLTADEMAKLQKNPNSFSTKLTEEAYLRAICTHKDHQNHITLEKLPNGKHRCSICQSEFYLVDLNTTKEEIEATCNNIYDLLQSIKTYYGNTPDAMREFYLMIGFIPKIKELWEIAKTYFDKATGGGSGLSMNNDQSGFAVLSNIFGGGAMAGIAPGIGMGNPGGYYGGAPMGGQPWYNGAPVPQGAMQTPGWGQPAQPQGQMPPAQAPAPGGNPAFAQPPAYGYNPNFYGPAPGVTPSVGNPIGYVDNTQRDFTNQAGQPTSPTQPPMPAAPTNPNLEQNKAEVGKTFAG
jgi:hypothetical protein